MTAKLYVGKSVCWHLYAGESFCWRLYISEISASANVYVGICMSANQCVGTRQRRVGMSACVSSFLHHLSHIRFLNAARAFFLMRRYMECGCICMDVQ